MKNNPFKNLIDRGIMKELTFKDMIKRDLGNLPRSERKGFIRYQLMRCLDMLKIPDKPEPCKKDLFYFIDQLLEAYDYYEK